MTADETARGERILRSETTAFGVMAFFIGLLGLLLWLAAALAGTGRDRWTNLLCGAALLAVASGFGLKARQGRRALRAREGRP